jgi:ribose transport system substrate-binding protein
VRHDSGLRQRHPHKPRFGLQNTRFLVRIGLVSASNHNRYVVKSLVHATQVLSAFTGPGDVLRLRDVVGRTGLNKGMCFRLLYTLHDCGFLEKIGQNTYRMVTEIRRRRRFRVGYAAQGQDTSFPREILGGLTRAAEHEQVELIVVDNRYQRKVALRNASLLIREQVDLVIEFQTDEAVAPAIASKYLEAKIPFIAIDIPHPGGTYFGANNYEAGLLAGRHLGRWAKKHWDGAVDEIMVIELARAGPLPQARIRGMLAGINEVVHVPESCPVVHLDGDGQFRTAMERVRNHLREASAKRILVGAANDPSALGALRALQEAGRADQAAITGQNAEAEAREELRVPRTRLIGSVGFFPEKYGDGLIRLALDILAKKVVPPAVFIKHQLITPENVDHFYPNDSLMRAG